MTQSCIHLSQISSRAGLVLPRCQVHRQVPYPRRVLPGGRDSREVMSQWSDAMPQWSDLMSQWSDAMSQWSDDMSVTVLPGGRDICEVTVALWLWAFLWWTGNILDVIAMLLLKRGNIIGVSCNEGYPIQDTRVSVLRLKSRSEMGWIGELWLKTYLHK